MSGKWRTAVLAAAAMGLLAGGARAEWTWTTPTQWERPTRGRTVEPAGDGGLTLTPYELVTDELGIAPVAANPALRGEPVSGSRIIRKQFLLDDATASGGVLSIAASGPDTRTLEVTFNGRPLGYENPRTRVRPFSGTFPDDHEQEAWRGTPFKSYWRGGWHAIPVSAELLTKGLNTVVVRAREGDSWVVLIEPSLHPDRSAVSHDGGVTWDGDRLGARQDLNGEYLVRLQLARHPASGWVESEPVDLRRSGPDSPIGSAGTVRAVRVSVEADAPAGTRVELLARVGSTPRFDPQSWTPWTPVEELARGASHGRKLSDLSAGWGQWRAVLHSADRRAAPRLKAVRMSADLSDGAGASAAFESVRVEQPDRIIGSVPFVHAPLDGRLELLRERYKLDEIIAGCEEEFDAMATLARWVARRTNVGNHERGALRRTMPDYDAFLAMELADKKLTHGMCVHEAATFVQLATALGWPARRSTWSHAIAEVWLNGQGKWVAFDASGGFGYQFPDGRGANFMDLANAWTSEGVGQIFQAYPQAAKINRKRVPERSVQFFSRPWFVMRSNFLESAWPDEPGHGGFQFKYNGNLHYLHPLKAPLPWFDFYSRRLGDFNFSCNQAYLHLTGSTVADSLTVTVEHDMPNFARFEKRIDGGAWAAATGEFDWAVKPGRNVLEVRPLNAWQARAVDAEDAAVAERTLKLLPPSVSRVELDRK